VRDERSSNPCSSNADLQIIAQLLVFMMLLIQGQWQRGHAARRERNDDALDACQELKAGVIMQKLQPSNHAVLSQIERSREDYLKCTAVFL